MPQEDQLLEAILRSFHKDAKKWIFLKEKDPSTLKDKNGNIPLDEKFIESFCNREQDSLKPLKPLKSLTQLAEILKKDYLLLTPSDIYFILSHVLMNLFNFLMWEREDINMTYKSGVGYGAFQSQLVIKPNHKKPKDFSHLYIGKNFEMVKDIIKQTLLDANKKYDAEHFHFELTFNLKLYSENQEIVIGDRITVSIKDGLLKIIGKYSGNPAIALERLKLDLNVVLSLLEMCDLLHIEDTEKRIGRSTLKGGLIQDQDIQFTYSSGPLVKNTSMDAFLMTAIIFEKHFKKFKEMAIGFIPIHYFTLLSEKFDDDPSLRIIPQFFSSEDFRFPRTEFLNYWTALEILLGNPKGGSKEPIKKSLIKAYELFYPKEKNLSIEEKTISKLWKIRNDMIHNGKIHIEEREIWKIKGLVKHLFDKILLARMTDKFLFTIQAQGKIEMRDL